MYKDKQDTLEEQNRSDHQLVDELFSERDPSQQTHALINDVRKRFTNFGHDVVSTIAPSPERTLALRKLHDASMHVISALEIHDPQRAGKREASTGRG